MLTALSQFQLRTLAMQDSRLVEHKIYPMAVLQLIQTNVTAQNFSGAGVANTPILFGGLNASGAGYVEYCRATTRWDYFT